MNDSMAAWRSTSSSDHDVNTTSAGNRAIGRPNKAEAALLLCSANSVYFETELNADGTSREARLGVVDVLASSVVVDVDLVCGALGIPVEVWQVKRDGGLWELRRRVRPRRS